MENLQRLYETILIGSKICSENDLKLYFSNDGTIDSGNQGSGNNSRLTLRKTIYNRNTRKQNDDVKCGFQNTKYDESEINNKLSKLGQIHTILEHLLTAQRNFKVKNCKFNCDHNV